MQFKLSKNFIEKYKDKDPDWGPLGKLTYKRSYARELDDGKLEEWYQTCERVVNGIYELQRRHVVDHLGSPWNTSKAQKSAQEMYSYMFDMKFLPPGRGLAQMGSEFVMNDTGAASVFNCAFASTENIDQDFAAPFCLLLEVGMYGVGPGFDTRGANKVKLREPKVSGNFIVEDSREGWSALIKRILDSYVGIGSFPENIDYSQIRPFGTKIKRFGGTASGPEALIELVANIKKTLDTPESYITSSQIVDLANYIGVAVVAGGSRRIAEIAFGDYRDKEYIALKDDYEKVKTHRWASNNSIFAEIGMDYSEVSKHTAETGEPGYMWLDNARKYSRMGLHVPDFKDMLVAGANPCNEQSLEDSELCCVSGDTKIQTKTGIYEIKDLVDKNIEIFNGEEWSEVIPFIAGKNKKLYRVYLSDGSYLDCTDNHEWSVKGKTKRNFKKLQTTELQEFDRLPKFEIKKIEGNFEPYAFEWGFFAGDGYLDDNRIKTGYSSPVNRINMTKILKNVELAKELNNKNNGIPVKFMEMDEISTLEFIAGYIEAGGNVSRQRDTDSYRIYGTEPKMRDLQLLLRRVGINRVSIRCMYPQGQKTNFGQRNYDLWYLHIESYDCQQIPTRLKKALRISTGLQKNNAYTNSKPISRLKNQRIIKVEELPNEHTVYCFTEPKRHMGVFNNVLTYQCLCESFPARCENLAEYKRVLKFAYLYAKTTTLLKTPWPKTNAIMLKNRRIGLSQSGVLDNIAKVGFREHMRWCDEGYEIVKYWDELYSDWLCIPRSKKKTSEKPSGSVSLLTGSRPGVHDTPAKSKWYIRRVEVLKNSPLVKAYKDAGYNVPQSVYKKESLVIEVPVEEKNWTPFPLSIWPQLELAAQMQEHWADNQVSCTVYVPDHEKEQLALALSMYETRLKGISFLPYNNNYEQAPYEAISEEKYIELIKNLKPVDLSNAYHEVTDKFCDSDVCQI